MSSTVPADGKSTLTPRTATLRTSDWIPAMVSRFNASSVPARHSGAPLYVAMISPRYFSCVIPSAVSAAVNASWLASPWPASLFLPASNHGENIARLTHQRVGSTSPNIQMPPTHYHPLHRKRNRPPVVSCLERNPSRMDRPQR
jgi:hypothetical protein